jgi:hypothetical protein
MNSELAKDLTNGFFFIFLEVIFFQHLSIFGASIDPILFYAIWLVQRYERTKLLLFLAILAFFQDAMFDFWGLSVFSKTLTFFILYNIIKKKAETQLQFWQIFMIIGFTAFLNNIILFSYGSFFKLYAIDHSSLILIFGNSVYTALVGLLIYIFRVKN